MHSELFDPRRLIGAAAWSGIFLIASLALTASLRRLKGLVMAAMKKFLLDYTSLRDAKVGEILVLSKLMTDSVAIRLDSSDGSPSESKDRRA
ncbi:MAG: hypothetical protein IT578_09550 [Verrucomicrobiae bacterium]|nr:hypothetical protein [Verrucomicrobiae bacterium]